MNIQVLENRILEISNEKELHSQEIINGVIGYLEYEYLGDNQTFKNAQILNELKIKIISTMLAFPNHKADVNTETDYEQLFDLTHVELDLLDDVFKELESEGKVYSLENEIGLNGLETMLENDFAASSNFK